MRAVTVVSFVCALAMGTPTVSASNSSNSSSLGNLTWAEYPANWTDGEVASALVASCDLCDSNAHCAASGAQQECTCNTGFWGNGVVCEDLD
eukprot:1165545-Rhodomonas_salina.2